MRRKRCKSLVALSKHIYFFPRFYKSNGPIKSPGIYFFPKKVNIKIDLLNNQK